MILQSDSNLASLLLRWLLTYPPVKPIRDVLGQYWGDSGLAIFRL